MTDHNCVVKDSRKTASFLEKQNTLNYNEVDDIYYHELNKNRVQWYKKFKYPQWFIEDITEIRFGGDENKGTLNLCYMV